MGVSIPAVLLTAAHLMWEAYYPEGPAMRTLTQWCSRLLLPLCVCLPVLSWAQQDPAQEVVLPAPITDGKVSLEAAIAGRRSVKEFSDTALTLQEIGQLAWAAQGITEPEKGLRAAPSAGAMYPIHLYLVTADGLYRYLPQGHKLQKLPVANALATFRGATSNQPAIQQAPLTLIVTADFGPMRERFAQRAEPFVYIEAGHVGQNIQLQACVLGLGSLPIGGFDPATVAQVLSLPDEHTVVYLMAVGHPLVAPAAP